VLRLKGQKDKKTEKIRAFETTLAMYNSGNAVEDGNTG
jgi:hypothetical protein